jgi:hypothetical protein
MMIRCLLAGLTAGAPLFLIPKLAFAQTNWYIYDVQDNSCVTSLGGYPATPEFFITFARNHGTIPGIQITRNSDGTIKQVEVTIQDFTTVQPYVANFFTSDAACEDYRAYMMQNNLAADPNELK